jgi:chorismate mutase
MILRSQADTQFEQTARVQIDVQYGDFLRSLAAQPLKRNQVEAVLVELFSERAELSLRVAQNKASPDQLKVITQYEYVRSRLESLLTMAELGVIDAQRGGATDQQLKNGYAEELSRTTGNLNDADKDLLLDIIVKHIRMAQGETGRMNAQSVEELIEKQGASFMHARMEMESLFDEVQLEQVDQFMGRLHNNLYRNRSMSDQ